MAAPHRPLDDTTDLPPDHDATTDRSTGHGEPRESAGLPDVPGYATTAELARGGMGAVFAAHDPAFGRDVAVKVMHAGQDAARFVVESRITARLPHPGVPPVYALGTLPDGRPYLAMKLIRGETLAAYLRRADRTRLLGVFEQICQTVGYAHTQGVVHRDLKPANVMVGAFGEVLVMDWGLAREVRSADCGVRNEATPDSTPHSDETRAGTVKGTPAYMAPEQARGEAVDARADVFALGGILAVVLTGKPPFVADSAVATVRLAAAANLSGAADRLDACGADAELVALAKACLAPAAADRPADGEAVAAAVAAYRNGVERRLRAAERERAAADARAAEQRKKKRVQVALAATVALLALGAGGFAAYRAEVGRERAAADAQRELTAEQTRVREAQEAAERLRLDGDRRLAEERTAGTIREHQARNGQVLTELVGRCETALRDADDAPAAARALAEIETRFTGGGGEALMGRIGRCRTDLAVVQALDRVDNDWWSARVGRDSRDGTGRARRLAGPLADFGIRPGQTPDDDAAARINVSLARSRLVGALDLWLMFDPTPAVRKLLAVADPDPFRDQLRDTFVSRNTDRLAELVVAPEMAAQPPRLALAVAAVGPLPGETREGVLERVARRRPDSYPVVMSLGNLYPAGERGTAAPRVRWYQAALSLRPASAVAWNNQGVALRAGGKDDRAVECYREAIKHDPTYAPVRNNLGVVFADRHEYTAAADEFRAAVKLDPTEAVAHYNLGLALKNLDDAAGSIAAYRDAVTHDPAFVQAHVSLCKALYHAGKVDDALAAARGAVKAAPADARLHALLGGMHLARQEHRAAVRALEEAARLDPDNVTIRRALTAARRDADAAPPP